MTPHQLAKRLESGETFGFIADSATVIASMPRRNGCHNRAPFVAAYYSSHGDYIDNFSKDAECEYTLSLLGQSDKSCEGCKHKVLPGSDRAHLLEKAR